MGKSRRLPCRSQKAPNGTSAPDNFSPDVDNTAPTSAYSSPCERRQTGVMLNADLHLDATGLVCPEPLMLVRNRVREMRSGQVLHVQATDPSTARDFRNFCRFMGHEMVAEELGEPLLEFWIRKG
jgi:tRNA 2-thiouridine synthesizing protein A